MKIVLYTEVSLIQRLIIHESISLGLKHSVGASLTSKMSREMSACISAPSFICKLHMHSQVSVLDYQEACKNRQLQRYLVTLYLGERERAHLVVKLARFFYTCATLPYGHISISPSFRATGKCM